MQIQKAITRVNKNRDSNIIKEQWHGINHCFGEYAMPQIGRQEHKERRQRNLFAN
jgi:hypothetical protein